MTVMAPATERSGIRWGTTQIPYSIRRSARRGTVSVAVEPSGEVVLTAPQATSVERLDRVVRQKARWIVERVRQGRRLPRATKRELVSGETVLYLGRNYRLRVVEAAQGAPARLDRGWLVVTVERGLGTGERAKAVREGLVAWYRPRAQAQLHERAERWGQRLHIHPRGVLVRDPRQRWGSCDPTGTLRFSWRIIQAPPTLVDYVVAHELVHLYHRGHTPRFWATLGRVIPDYEVRRARLRAVGPALIW
jgi:predicted metal-dependent hydrolase